MGHPQSKRYTQKLMIEGGHPPALASISAKHELRLGFGGTNSYLPSTRSIPEKSNSNLGRGSLPTRSVSSDLSREITCDTLATESFGSPVTPADKVTLPGARDHFRLLVSGTQTAVEIRLWLSGSL